MSSSYIGISHLYWKIRQLLEHHERIEARGRRIDDQSVRDFVLHVAGRDPFESFVPGFGLPAQGFWVMATYVAAQLLLVAGVLRARSDTSSPRRPAQVSVRPE